MFSKYRGIKSDNTKSEITEIKQKIKQDDVKSGNENTTENTIKKFEINKVNI